MIKNFVVTGVIILIIAIVIFVGVKSAQHDTIEDETEESHFLDETSEDLPELPLEGMEDYGGEEVQDPTQI